MSYVSCNFHRMSIASRVLTMSKALRPNLSILARYKSENVIVTIGDVSKQVKLSQKPEYVPRKYLINKSGQEADLSMLKHLKWMLQKDVLSQDIFLIGGPGTRRRKLALAYLELTEREVEFIALSRDTTESDLKQRREIESSTAYYHDQTAVRAAINGRILIIEGVEKAERNVLPILNNLLENREMHLEDGRFLVPATRYDKLLQNHSQEELDSWRLVRVSEDFRVIALGMPSPKYPGHPLDPPLRSRFQARHISPPTFQEQLDTLKSLVTDIDTTRLKQLLSCAHAFVTQEAVTLGLPDFPLDNLSYAAVIMDKCPYLSVFDIFYRCYPYKLFLGKEGQSAVESILDTFNVPYRIEINDATLLKRAKVDKRQEEQSSLAVSITHADGEVGLNVSCGTRNIDTSVNENKYVETNYQNNLLTSMLESHIVSDFCLIGPKGCGKSITIHTLANLMGYEVEPIVLYQDMTSRDLIQQRSTLSNGDTIWKNSPLVDAALEGKLAILDGINRIDSSTLTILHRLVHDRELQLHDGKRLIRADRYDEIKEKYNKTDEELLESGVLRIHPSFRIVALAESPVINASSKQWLNTELLSLFLFHEMRPLTKSEEAHIIRSKYGELSSALLNILELAHVLRSSNDPTVQSLAGFLSTRQLLRIAGRMNKFQTDDAYSAVQRACLARFLPAVAKQALDDCCNRVGIVPAKMTVNKNVKCQVIGNTVQIGSTVIERYNTTALTKVPDILFYDVPQHVALLENLLQDFSVGQNLLLVGNQGVGKNKIVDRLLQLLNRPREYIQLHRDTTVQTLTLQPMVRDGKVVYEDSPLVQAVKLGHVLVVDEADKAPTHVTCILKTLVESGEMTLSDGRRIISSQNVEMKPNMISLHPDFRMIVLANRPGFPFLGHDFFGALGDLFSTHVVDNPSIDNEIQLLKEYGPNVDKQIIFKLVKAFGELRNMADQGLVSYPYSTREVVNIVKHLEKFPQEPLANVVRNVFDFDRYSEETFNTLVSVLHKHGIPLDTSPNSIALAKQISLPGNKISATWNFSNKQEVLHVQEKYVKFKSPMNLKQKILPLDRVEARSALFTEMQSYWTIPIGNVGIIAGLSVIKGTKGDGTDDKINILTMNPLKIFSMNQESDTIQETFLPNLVNYEPGYKPRFTMAIAKDKNILVHEETNNILLLVNVNERSVRKLELLSFFNMASDKISNAFRNSNPRWRMKTDLIESHNQIVFYTCNSNKMEVTDLSSMCSYTLNLPFDVESILIPSEKKWLIQDTKKNKYVLKKSNDSVPCPNVLQQVEESSNNDFKIGSFFTCANSNLNSNVLSAALKQKIDAPNRLLVTSNTYASIVVGFPDLDSFNEIHSWPRSHRNESFSPPIVMENGQIVRTLLPHEVPDEVLPKTGRYVGIAGYLEVVDTVNHKLRYIPIPEPVSVSHVTQFLYPNRYPLYVASKSNQDFVTVDAGGCVRLWETSLANIEKSLGAWRRMVGSDNENLQITKERYSGLDVSGPKHGKMDEKNEPHVGGNTWAGGTGGRDTAGLGGKGGPYRLDAGHTVHQLSDEEKNAVPEHIKKAAREMGLKAFQQRLKEINMSEYDHKLYFQFSNAVQMQVKALRNIIDSLQSKSKERQWCRHQTSGELDDTKLIEGLTGERTIYRRRTEKEPEFGTPPSKPKRLKLVVDVSGSMYRFNGHDGRLDREMEACVMVMEAFSGYEGKFQYDIVGHSGDDYNIVFVKHTQPPADNKRRLEIIKTMHAHSQFCESGDNTLQATQHAIVNLAKEDADERIVVVLSDANFDRYGIRPEQFAKILTANPDVNAFAIFIGSLGDQATNLTKRITAGRAFVCMDLKDIPRILQQIFSASLLSTTR